MDSSAEKSSSTAPEMKSCRRKKSEDASFLVNLRDHFDEFVHASMDEHKTCFQNTISKMFRMSKVAAEKNKSSEQVENIVPLKTTTS